MYVIHMPMAISLISFLLVTVLLVGHIFLIGAKKEYTYFSEFCNSVTMQGIFFF